MIPVIKLIRPRQWTKNILVFAAVIFSQHYLDLSVWLRAFLAFAGFSLIASSIYVINDLCDIEKDRLHPEKKNRPIASGAIKPPLAVIISVVLMLSGLAIGWKINYQLMGIYIVYIITMILYSLKLKHVLLIDVFIVAGGLTARAVAGALAINVWTSNWLLVFTFFIALMLAMVKRRQELARLGDEIKEKGRLSLHGAPKIEIWDNWINMMSAITILGYALYTIDPQTVENVGSRKLLVTVPFVVFAVLRYHIAVYSGSKGEDPTETLLRDKWIILCVFFWLLTVLAVFLKWI